MVGVLATNFTLDNLIKTQFPALYQERKTETDLPVDWIPLFVLETTLLVGETISLYVFEPRYKLMIRRCLLGSNKFGVILHGSYVGVLVQVTRSRLSDDGRFILKVLGEQVFRVLESQVLDDYKIGRVQWITDEEPEDEIEISLLCSELRRELIDVADLSSAPETNSGFLQWVPHRLTIDVNQKQLLLETNSKSNKIKRLIEFTKQEKNSWIQERWLPVLLFLLLLFVNLINSMYWKPQL